ncbi:Serum paraoxonase/arylesterase 2 [Thoreauomyces humboldtii]|nr:Serum paraoxonase/arylesterase 2 [Thoreauomyces humboldtii]
MAGSSTVTSAAAIAIIALLAILLGVLVPTGRVAYRVSTDRSSLTEPTDTSCHMLNDPLLQGCEDGVLHAKSNQIFYACAIDPLLRLKYFPGLGNFDPVAAQTPKGAIVVLDLKTLKSTRLTLVGHPPSFHAHGITIYSSDPETVRITVISHQPGHSVLETFDHTLGTDTAIHVSTFNDQKLLFAPNNLVAVGKDKYYATNDRGDRTSFFPTLLDRTGLRSSGHVVYIEDGKAIVATPKLTYPNGIAATPDGQTIYVADSVQATISVYSRKHNNKLRLMDTIPIPHYLDNISLHPKTGALILTGANSFFTTLQKILSHSLQIPGIASITTNNTSEGRFYGKKFSTELKTLTSETEVELPSVAVADGKGRVFITGLAGGLMMCDKGW